MAKMGWPGVKRMGQVNTRSVQEIQRFLDVTASLCGRPCPLVRMTPFSRGLWLESLCEVDVILVDNDPGESPPDGNISDIDEKGLEWLIRAFGLGREP